MRGSFSNYQQNNGTQMTIVYDNGESESYNLPMSSDVFAQQLPQILSQAWLTLHLGDQTVMLLTSKITKIEVKPPLTQIQGAGVLSEVQRVTTMQRGAAGRLAMSE
ncbi:MAG: hypothetical protein ACRCT1_11640 [Microcoleaceae cyanobacterium]